MFTDTNHGYTGEAELVEKIRQDPSYHKELELVAEIDEKIVGYGLLSEVTLESETTHLTGLCLAPLCVDSDYQSQGIGTQLMQTLESKAKNKPYAFISILGHPEYYSAFQYVPAHIFGVRAPFDVPKEAYLIKELVPHALQDKQGTIRYSKAFN